MIGDKAGLWEELFGEPFKWIAHVEDDVAHVFTSGHMIKIARQANGGFSQAYLEDLFIGVIDEEGCKLSLSKAASEGVFIDSDG